MKENVFKCLAQCLAHNRFIHWSLWSLARGADLNYLRLKEKTPLKTRLLWNLQVSSGKATSTSSSLILASPFSSSTDRLPLAFWFPWRMEGAPPTWRSPSVLRIDGHSLRTSTSKSESRETNEPDWLAALPQDNHLSPEAQDFFEWRGCQEILKRLPVGWAEKHGGRCPPNVQSLSATVFLLTSRQLSQVSRSARY